MDNKILEIKNLKALVSETGEEILSGIDLEIGDGETHVIMGPNGGGKSTLVNVIAGRDSYEVSSGSIKFKSKNLLNMNIDERSREGIFLAFQYPSEIPGVRPWQFMKAAVDAKRKANGDPELSVREFSKIYEGFSGGEKKRNEVFQMMMLEPNLALLDETDSGLDVDALKAVGDAVNNLRDSKRSFLIVTHYQRLLDHIKPDFVHILINGKIAESGNSDLVKKIENDGYESFA